MNISEMSGEMAYYHDNTAIVLSGLWHVEFRGNQTRPALLFSIRNNCNKSSVFLQAIIFCHWKLTLLAHGTTQLKINVASPELQTKVLPNTVRECVLFMSPRFTQGHQLDPDSLMAGLPFITAEPALWFRHNGHLAQNDWDAFEIFNNALRIREKSANYVHTHIHTQTFSHSLQTHKRWQTQGEYGGGD